MRTLLALLFIGGIGAAAVYVGQRPTIARGEVFAAQFLANSPLARDVRCDDQIPIGLDGAKFRCTFQYKDGDSQDLEFQISRDLRLSQRVLSDPQPEHHHAPGADPWGD
jgi:hypothetical protein